MNPDTSAPTPPAIDDQVTDRIDEDLAALGAGAVLWTRLTLAQRVTLLRRVRTAVASAAADWAQIANATKGIDAGHPLAGEEWLSGPYATLVALDTSIRTLTALASGRSPLDGVRMDRAPGDRVRAHVFPADGVDRALLMGFSGEVWLRPGVTGAEAIRRAGLAQRRPTESGGVGLVLGAGNVSSIPVLDVLYELLAHNRVSLLKLNPTQDQLLPVFRQALLPLIEPGLVRILTGGGDVGAHLTARPEFSHVHITGSAATFDAIVWGTDAQAARRRREHRPRLQTPITGELGGVAPIIVVPGDWTAADLAYQAEHVATMRLQNAGHNCIAGQVVIVSDDWAQRDAFLAALRTAYASAPQRPVWYPNSTAKLDGAAADHPDAARFGDRLLVTPSTDAEREALERTEYFSPVLGVVTLPGTGQAFLDAAVEHANARLAGTLGANVIVDPVTERALGDGFERAIADLRYGNIAINGWTGFSFTAPTLSWGAYPGHTLEDVGSGIGVVHNGLLLDDVERSVLRGPFRPFPRVFGRRSAFTILPKPPWFVTSRTGAAVSEGFVRFRITGSLPGLLMTLTRALRS